MLSGRPDKASAIVNVLNAFRRGLWDHLPIAFRRLAIARVFGAMAPRVATDARPVEPIYVAGLLSSPVGIGEGARLNLDAMKSLGVAATGIDLGPLFGRAGLVDRDYGGGEIRPGPGTIILHFNPDQLPFALFSIGKARLAGKRIIGFWSWELSEIPDSWLRGFSYVDEVWVPSRFVADAVRARSSKPVRIMPHPVALQSAGRSRRAEFGLKDDVFTVATIFDMASCFARKNPIAAVEGFRHAFRDDPKYMLLLKVTGGDTEPALLENLKAAIGAASNIRFVEDCFSRQEMLDFIASVDVLLSPHRSEGFGLSMAQAMLSGVLVIATGWSGNLEFMDSDSAELLAPALVPVTDPQGCYESGVQYWSDPDVGDIADALKRLAKGGALCAKRRQAAKLHALSRLGSDAYRVALEEALSVGVD